MTNVIQGYEGEWFERKVEEVLCKISPKSKERKELLLAQFLSLAHLLIGLHKQVSPAW